MANVLNRITREYIRSANTPEYDPTVWIINPNLSLVRGYPQHYWVINPDDTVTLLPEADRPNADLWLPYMNSTLDDAKAIKNQMVNQHRDKVQDGGWVYNGVHYDSDAMARQNMAGTMTLVHTGYVLPDNFVWRASSNINVHFDNASFTTFYQASCVWMEMNYQISWYHKAMIAQLTSIPAVAAYPHTAGWAPGYTPVSPAS